MPDSIYNNTIISWHVVCMEMYTAGMLKVTRTKNWSLFWGPYELPEGADAIGLVTPDRRPTGVLIRLADGKYVQGNIGELRSLPQRSVERALSAPAPRAKIQAKPKPHIRRGPK